MRMQDMRSIRKEEKEKERERSRRILSKVLK